tara:strand:+ start:426 stop:605 length:180 start_codon:yes stop_codon:yes gene_type:complete
MGVNKLESQIDDNKSSAKVDLNRLMQRVKIEQKKSRRSNMVVSAAAISAVAVFGIILTL